MRWDDKKSEVLEWGKKVKTGTASWQAVADHYGCSIEAVRHAFRFYAKKEGLQSAVGADQDILRLREQNKELENKYKAALRYRDLEDALVDVYGEYGGRFDPVPPPEFVMTEPGIVEETAVGLLSDWHLWEEVLMEETGGLAGYNMDIAAGYMQYLAEHTIDIVQNKLKGYRFKKYCGLLLGDFVSTNLHNILEHSPGTAFDSLLEGQVLLGWFLLDICRHFEEVEIWGVPGNHGRLTKQKRYKKRYANFDWALYNQLAIMLANQPNITFHFPKSFFQIAEIEGHNFLILHGDDIKSWNQIPWYGIDRAVRKFREILDAHGKSFEYVAMGHFHNTGELEMCRGEKLINGSAIGTTDFSLGKLFTGNAPHQTIFGVHKEHGISWRFHLELKEPDERRYYLDNSQEIHQQWRDILSGR